MHVQHIKYVNICRKTHIPKTKSAICYKATDSQYKCKNTGESFISSKCMNETIRKALPTEDYTVILHVFFSLQMTYRCRLFFLNRKVFTHVGKT